MLLQNARGRALGLALLVFASRPAAAQEDLVVRGRPALQAQGEAIVGSDQESWSILAWSLERQQPVLAIQPNRAMIPASNNKVFSAIWALAELGPDYRFPTDLLITGPIGRDGVLKGSVVLRGSGDPAFGYPQYDRDPMTPLRTMARQLKARGVRAVEGGVIGDGTVFDTLLYGPKWPRDTGNGVSAYAPRVSGLAFQRNLIWVEAIPTAQGVQIRLDPQAEGIPVVSSLRRGGGRAFATRHPDEDTIRVRGGISGRGPHRYGIGVTDPALMAAGGLKQALMEEGIAVRGPSRTGSTPQGATLVHRHLSIPLGEMIAQLNRHSDNFFAEHLFKAAAAKAIGQGSYTRGGIASANFFIQQAGVPYGQIYQADGSGLSEYNRASAYALVRALLYANQQPWSELFHQSLAVAGDRAGTLRRMFVGTPAAGNLHAKTGYIRGVRTLSGYVKAQNGETIVFSFLYNGRNTSGARGVQNQLGALLAGYGGAGAGVQPAAQAKPAERVRRAR